MSNRSGRGERLDQKFRGVVIKNKDGMPVSEDQWIVFLAKDNAVPAMLAMYESECERLGAAEEQLRGVRDLRVRVAAWREAHPEMCKVPDLNPGELRP